MEGSRKIFYALLLLTAINILFFIFRDHSYYRKYSGYKELYGECEENCRKQWMAFLGPYPESERKEAMDILRTDSLFTSAKTELEKTVAIGRLLYNRFTAQLGTSDQQVMASPLSVFRNLENCGRCRLWCGDFARMFNFFALSAGITSRYIQIENEVNGDDHVVNEVYLSSQDKWALVDLTNNMLVVTHGRSVLDLVTFRERLAVNKVIETWQADGQAVRKVPVSLNEGARRYYETAHLLHFYHYIDLGEAYRFDNRLKRYIFPAYWYEIYSEKQGSNVLYYIKFLCLVTWFVLAAFYIKMLLHDRNK